MLIWPYVPPIRVGQGSSPPKTYPGYKRFTDEEKLNYRLSDFLGGRKESAVLNKAGLQAEKDRLQSLIAKEASED